MTGRREPVQGPDVGLRRRPARATRTTPRRSRSRARPAGPGEVPAVRGLAAAWRAGCGRARRRSARSAASYYMAVERATARAYKRLGKTHRPHRQDERRADVQVLLRPRGGLGLHDGRGARARRRHESGQRRLDDAAGHQRAHEHRRPATAAPRAWPTARTPCIRSCCTTTTPTCEPTAETGTGSGTPSPATPAGWADWTVDLTPVRGQAGRAVHHQRDRLGHAGAGHVGRRRQGDARRRRSRDDDRLRERHRRLDRRAAARGDGLPRRQLDPRDPAVHRGRRRRHRRTRLHRVRVRGHERQGARRSS